MPLPPPAPSGPVPVARGSSDSQADWDDDDTFVVKQQRQAEARAAEAAKAAAQQQLQPTGGRDPLRIGLAVAALIFSIVVIVVVMWPTTGVLVITVAGPDNAVVEPLEVIVDDQTKCRQSPCRLDAVERGVHIVKVVAPGYAEVASKAATVESGHHTVLEIALVPLKGSGVATGLRVPALGQYLRLSIDGKDSGPLPQEVTDLEPGAHVVRIDGNERYEPFEQKVTLKQGQILSLAPQLKVLKGLADISAGANAEGAQVVLDCGQDDRTTLRLPTKVDIPASKECKLLATKRGYQDFEQPVKFSDGKAQVAFTVELAEGDAAAGVAAAPQRAAPARVGRAGGQRRAAGGKGKGTIFINSIPPSTVLVDGRPLGRTPKTPKVKPGKHRVVFMHPKKGKKALTVKVPAGGSVVAAVKF